MWRRTVTSCSGRKRAGSSQTACVSSSRATTLSSRGVAERQVAEAGADRPLEEAPELHGRMIADLLESEAVAERPRGKFPWLLVAASVLLIALLLYVLFVGYLRS